MADIDLRERANRSADDDRGRQAEKVTDIPAGGWKDLAIRVKDQAREDNLPLLAAGVALYFLLALIPALIAAVSIYGLVADPADVERQISEVTAAAPEEVGDLVTQQLQRITETSSSSLGFSLVVSLAIALWAASSGMRHLIRAINTVYDGTEDRGFLRLVLLSLLFTVGAVIIFAAAIGVIAVLPRLLDDVGFLRPLLLVVPHLVLAGLFLLSTALIYRFAPNRDARFRWVSSGSAVATALWVVGSVAFSIYVSNFGSYNETYGSLAAVIVLILWLVITSYAILIGAEFNSEVEAQTARDTTKGPHRPMGQRDAVKADTLGEAAGR